AAACARDRDGPELPSECGRDRDLPGREELPSGPDARAVQVAAREVSASIIVLPDDEPARPVPDDRRAVLVAGGGRDGNPCPVEERSIGRDACTVDVGIPRPRLLPDD